MRHGCDVPRRQSDPTVGLHPPAQHVGRADEIRHEPARGTFIELLRRPELLDPPGVHDGDPIAHRQRLFLVVGHVHEGDPDLALDPLELELELASELQVEGAEGLVEQEYIGSIDQCPGERHALLLPAGELTRAAPVIPTEVDQLERLRDPPSGLGLGHTRALQAKGDVVADIEVREQRVVLEDHVDRPLVGRIVRHIAPAEQDPPARWQLEAADHAQRRCLAAARRAQQREELAGANLQRDAVDREHLAKTLLQVEQLDLGGRRCRLGRHRAAEASPRCRNLLARVPGNATRQRERAGLWR